MKDMTSYPLMGPFWSSAMIMVSRKFLITFSCIFLIIRASDFSPFTVIVKATIVCILMLFILIYIFKIYSDLEQHVITSAMKYDQETFLKGKNLPKPSVNLNKSLLY